MKGPWLAIGNCNTVTNIDNMHFGNPVLDNEVRDFNDFIAEIGMVELRAVGKRYTWTNRQIYRRIDKALNNDDWLLTIIQSKEVIMNPGCSDHTLLSIQFAEVVKRSPRPFMLLN